MPAPSLSYTFARLGGWPRRVLAVTCLLLAAASALSGRGSAQSEQRVTSVVVATRLLPAGSGLSPRDVEVRRWPAQLAPPGALTHTTQAAGRRLAGPVRAGEPITVTRLIGADLSAGLPADVVAVPVEVTSAAFVRAGNTVDLLLPRPNTLSDSPDSGATTSDVLVDSARVLAVLGSDGIDTGGPRLLVATTPESARRVAAAAGRQVVASLRAPP